ncbi:DUF5115 domain-containing protein [uncultured Bacteroides sp.]|uniref:Outer membrane protein SusF domain-containing protein n=1 Tax=uncultured Bacteroides sp. TaxID=162156 RepID=UPI002619C2CF|nr:DUF5115 domain-containing protein [uncultured Bacteroides sp.]
MKSKLLYILALATSLVACTDDYTDWAAPLQSEPENPIDVSLSASAPSAIDIASVEGDSVIVFTATVNAPEGCVLASYKLTLNDTQDLPVSLGGKAAVSDLNNAVFSLYGRRPTERVMNAVLAGYVNVKGASVKVSQPLQLSVTPKAPFIDQAYYLVGDMCGWAVETKLPFNHSEADVYEDPVFSIVFTTTADNQYWKIIPKTNVDGGDLWAVGETGVVGVAVDGDASMSGTLTTTDPQAGKIEKAGMYRMVLNMMEYTYTIEELNFAPYIYEIGNNTGWGNVCPLAGLNYDGQYKGFAYLDGELKYKPHENDWNDDWEKASGDAYAGTLTTEGSDNIDAVAPGFYMMDVDLVDLTYKHTLIETMGVIGSATPGLWDADTDMTYDNSDGSWNLTIELTDGEIKIRANDGWDINWGGSIEEPTFNAAGNMAVTAGNYSIKFVPVCDGKNKLTMTKN